MLTPRELAHELTPPTQLFQLPDPDATLLTLFLTDAALHLPAFAIKSNLGLVRALEFRSRPEVANYLAAFHRLREQTQRSVALGALCGIIETAEDTAAPAPPCSAPIGPPPRGGGKRWADIAPCLSEPASTSRTNT